MKFFRHLPLHRVAVLGSLIGVKFNSHQCFANHLNPGAPALNRSPYHDAIDIAETSIHGQLSTEKASAALMTVYVDGDCVHNAAYGMSDAENRATCHIDNKMRIGTMTMIFTAAQMLNFCQKMNIDVNKQLGYDDWNAFGQSRFTIKNLLNHCAGLYPAPEEAEGPGILHGNLSSYCVGCEIVRRVTPMQAGKFLFSSDSYNLAGAYLQSQCFLHNLEEMTYPQVFQAMMSDMDLRNTVMDAPLQVISFLTKHYLNIDSEAIFSDASKRFASSGLISNSRDLAKFGDEMLYHEQLDFQKDKRIPFLRNPAKLWSPDKCLHHDEHASVSCAGHETKPEIWRSEVDPSGPSSSGQPTVTCMGYSYGWNVELVPTNSGDMHKYTLQVSSEGIGDYYTGALVVRYGTNRNPFVFCSESERLTNSQHNTALPANKERKQNSTKGIVVALLFNGGDIEAGNIAKNLAKHIERIRHLARA